MHRNFGLSLKIPTFAAIQTIAAHGNRRTATAPGVSSVR